MGGVSNPTQCRFQSTNEDDIDQAVLPLSEANLRSWTMDSARQIQDSFDHNHLERSIMVTIGLVNDRGRAIPYTNPSLTVNLEDCTER